MNERDQSRKSFDGDERIIGVKLRQHPSQVPPGFCAGAVNMRFRDGVPESRRGTVHLPWLNLCTAVSAGTVMSRGTTNHGAGRFKDADGLVWNIVARDGAVYASRANGFPFTVPLPAGETISGDVSFEQFQNTLLMFRATVTTDSAPLQCADLLIGFTTVPAATGPGASSMPANARAGKSAGNRLWLLVGKDEVWASDSLVHTDYDPVNQFAVTDGTPDDTVAMVVFNETSLVVLKERSVWRITEIIGDLSGSEELPVSKRYGCVAARSAIDIGTDLWWWSQDGPASLVITQFNELQVEAGAQRPMPGTDIDPLLKRVNKLHWDGICVGLWDRKVYFAVPLDDADATRFDFLNGVTSQAASEVLPLSAGVTYRYKRLSAETNVVIGPTTLTVSNDASTTAAAPGGQVNVSGAMALSSTVRQVFKGVNNAVLVCDLDLLDEQGRPVWQGYDMAEGIEPRFFFLSEYLGQDRLCFAGEDGWVCLYEEGFDGDAHPTPYVDLTVVTLPKPGQTLRVNGGTVVDPAVVSSNTGTTWGCNTLANARRDIWTDLTVTGGYYHGTSFWTSPDAAPVRISNGVRYYSLNGAVPAAVIGGGGDWGLIVKTLWAEVTATFISRAYTTAARQEVKRGMKFAFYLETYRPQYDVFAMDDGVAEETQPVADRTFSRVDYSRPFNKAPWDPTNVNADFASPYRGDYSVVCSNATAIREGFVIGLQQAQSPHRMRLHSGGRSVQGRLVNKAGRVRVIAIGYEALGGGQTLGVNQ
jgi:hypothetical protein